MAAGVPADRGDLTTGARVQASRAEAYGAWGEKRVDGRTVTGVIRSTVVVDEEGRVEAAMYGVQASGHVVELRRTLGLT